MRGYDFQKRWKSLITFDKIRQYKLIEIIQYSVIFFILNICVSHVLNHYYFDHIETREPDDIKTMTIWEKMKMLVIIIIETIVVTLCIFYMRKVALLVPPYGVFSDNHFEPFTALAYTAHIAQVFAFIEMLPVFKTQFALLGTILK
jgi:hypothetical protein